MKVRLELNRQHVHVLCEALDLYSRLLAGQINEIRHFFLMNRLSRSMERIDHKALDQAINVIKRTFFPEESSNSNMGITHPDLDQESKIAYEIHGLLKKLLFDDKHKYEKPMSMYSSPPLKVSDTEWPSIELVD
jgi:hypothetical protein